MSAVKELKPCPFCGEVEKLIIFPTEGERDMFTHTWVLCQNCEAEGPCKKRESEGIEAWNRRAS